MRETDFFKEIWEKVGENGRKSEKIGETKGKFYKLRVDKREFERKDTNTMRESQRKWEKVRDDWEKVREYGRK